MESSERIPEAGGGLRREGRVLELLAAALEFTLIGGGLFGVNEGWLVYNLLLVEVVEVEALGLM